jgi:hypothetical protein
VAVSRTLFTSNFKMKSYLKKISLFILPLLVFFAILEISLRRIPNDFKGKSQYLNQHAQELDILILGSSHSLSFIKPEMFQMNTFNAANLHQTLQFDAYIFNKYIEQMKQLKCVILPISYGSYFASLENSKDKWRLKNYNLYYGYKKASLRYSFEVLNGSTSEQLKSVIDYYLNDKSFISCTEKGYGIEFAKSAQADMNKMGKVAADRHTRDCSEENIESSMKAIESIIENCEKRNIRVILYTAPAWHTYRKEIVPKIMNQTMELTQQLLRKYDNVEYKSYLEDSNFHNDDFRDVDHLNEKGAEKFTEMIKKDFNLK